MITSYAYGHDFGNADTCGVLFEHGIQRTISIPSATALGSLDNLVQMSSALGGNDASDPTKVIKHGQQVLEYNGNEWFVGNLALMHTMQATTDRGYTNRYANPRSLHMLLATSASLISQTEYQLNVVTGLPVETFPNVELRKQVKAVLEGEHRFRLNGVRRLAIVRVLKVIMEGAGALIAFGATDDITQGCVDIGGQTTDLFVAEGQSPILYRCKGKSVGVETVADLVNQQFQLRYHRPLKLHESRTLLHAHVNKRAYKPIAANGQIVPASELGPLVENALITIGNEVASFVGTTWKTSEVGAVGGDIGSILLVGGGAYYFAGVMRDRIPHLVIPKQPELANAIGYAALAEQLY